MEKQITNVAVYVRKSREDEDEQALNRQQSVLIDHCEKNSWNWELFKEVGSSQDLDRPELQNMLEKVKLFHYDAIVVADQDRLSRNVVHFGQIKMILMNAGCFVVTPSKVFDYSKDSDDMFSDFMSVIAKSEYQQIKKRLVRGTKQSAREGNYLGKKVPIGYSYNRETKRLEKSEDAEIMRRLFELYMNGMSTKDIAFKFEHEGVMTSVGMKWTPAGVSRLLNNVVYAGHSLYGKTKQYKKDGKRVTEKTSEEEQILVKNTHEGIVSLEEWELVQTIKEKRNSRPPSLRLGKHKFSGLIRCSKCGAIHSFQTSRYKRKRISSCQTRHYNEDMTEYFVCDNKGANISEFEKLFYAHFSEYVDQLEKYVETIKGADLPEQTDNRAEQIDSKRKQIQKLEQQVKKTQQGFLMEIFSESEAQDQIKQLKGQIAMLEGQIGELEQQEDSSEVDALEQTLNKMKAFLEGSDDMDEREANEILREFVDAIVYTKTDNDMNIKIIMKDLQ
ncbi:recombinase family protein [Cytobacillus sp. NJ13]|nr:recombinase family protein [Cytobacillus sp. NJ13]